MTLWVALRRKLKVATCFLALVTMVVWSIILNLALRDIMPQWLDFSPIYSDNLRDLVKIWYTIAGLF